MDYLNNYPEIAEVLADGFANLYQMQPKFPVIYLANFLKNYTTTQKSTTLLVKRLVENDQIKHQIQRKTQMIHQGKQKKQKREKYQKEKVEGFVFRIKEAFWHQQFLNQFCEWIENYSNFSGVYIGQLDYVKKKIDLSKEDSEEAHLDLGAAKVIKYIAASHSHNKLMIGKMLPQQSLVGRLLNNKNQESGQGEDGQETEKKKNGDLYISSVQNNKQLHFFQYPRLGAFYCLPIKLKSSLSEKLFDGNKLKYENYKKIKEQFEKQQQERYNKFRAFYDEKSNSGATDKQLKDLEIAFESQQITAPKMQEYDSLTRTFVFCCDTFGQDRQINIQQRQLFKQLSNLLISSWQSQQKNILQTDINNQLKVLNENNQNSQQQIFIKLIQEQDRELPSHEQVQKHKGNDKLVELQINVQKIEKIKQYMTDQKYTVFLSLLLEQNILKYSEIIKNFCYFMGYSKEEITFSGTNLLNWQYIKKNITQQIIFQKINEFTIKGRKDKEIKPYALWERILRNVQKYEPTTVAGYNLYIGFMLRFLILSAKTRLMNNEARKAAVKFQQQKREEQIKQVEIKSNQRKEKLNEAKLASEGKTEEFDQETFLKIYDEEHPSIEIVDAFVYEPDKDLEIDVVEIPSQ